ncbi:MAG: AI-2E family transporter [Butyrivibrio sp.]|uniref:AI-2E family transporter n=1 Tax=Butyrivibrio sp. TaxID=28121 RepID=UPI0025FDC926|nr:AI-2E family transporter [Butyrivibrio sp.]MCR5772767.1 AI-2E family transporter [Butyrivibrio sp.]
MDKILKKLDKRYLKVCVYAAVTVLITTGLALLLISSGSFWAKLWAIFTAVLKPIVIGGIICYLFSPIVSRIEKLFNRKKVHKWARPFSVLLTFGIVFLTIALILVLIAIALYKNLESLNVESIQNIFVTLQKDYASVWNFVTQKLESSNVETADVSQIVTYTTNAVTNFFSGLLFGVIFSIYFLLDGNNLSNYWTKAFRLIFGKKAEDKTELFLKDADRAFSGYIRGQFTDALIVGVLITIILSFAGIPNALIVGVFAGLGNLVPYLGPVVGYITLVFVCLPSGAYYKMIIGIIIFALVMFIDGNIINPKLLSDNVEVHPLLVVAALIAGGAVGGIAGMLVAVPSAALIKLQFDRYLEKMSEKRKAEEAELLNVKNEASPSSKDIS